LYLYMCIMMTTLDKFVFILHQNNQSFRFESFPRYEYYIFIQVCVRYVNDLKSQSKTWMVSNILQLPLFRIALILHIYYGFHTLVFVTLWELFYNAHYWGILKEKGKKGRQLRSPLLYTHFFLYSNLTSWEYSWDKTYPTSSSPKCSSRPLLKVEFHTQKNLFGPSPPYSAIEFHFVLC
jgi:hypothetical protein